MQNHGRAVLERPGGENPAAGQQGTEILDRLESHGLETQGIFKISGNFV